jgi:hypothetical protein
MFRAGVIHRVLATADDDSTWSAADNGRARTLDARYSALGVSEEERRRLLPCAVLRAKFPGIRFPVDIETRMASLECKN